MIDSLSVLWGAGRGQGTGGAAGRESYAMGMAPGSHLCTESHPSATEGGGLITEGVVCS